MRPCTIFLGLSVDKLQYCSLVVEAVVLLHLPARVRIGAAQNDLLSVAVRHVQVGSATGPRQQEVLGLLF